MPSPGSRGVTRPRPASAPSTWPRAPGLDTPTSTASRRDRCGSPSRGHVHRAKHESGAGGDDRAQRALLQMDAGCNQLPREVQGRAQGPIGFQEQRRVPLPLGQHKELLAHLRGRPVPPPAQNTTATDQTALGRAAGSRRAGGIARAPGYRLGSTSGAACPLVAAPRVPRQAGSPVLAVCAQGYPAML